jgi:SAM-dependent methyltransferase
LIKDVIALPQDDGRWVLYNAFAHTALGVHADTLGFLSDLDTLGHERAVSSAADKMFTVWDVQETSNYRGLYADPTGFIRDTATWPEPDHINAPEMLDRMRKHAIVVDDEGAYKARLSAKTSVLDSEHFGNFHQALGQELIVNRRESPDKWWLNQKFQPDFRAVRPNLYGAVQESSLDRYFKKRFHEGHRVVDLGCGTGFYTAMIARTGASTLGVDPNAEFIAIAEEIAVPFGAEIDIQPIGHPGAMDSIPDDSADFVFMSDALLFYFVPVDPRDTSDVRVLLSDVRRILKPGGKFVSLEPNHAFWLKPWLGEVDHPYTVVTEHNDRWFGVGPTYRELFNTLEESEFALSHIEELTPDIAFESVDPRAFHFATEFPLWQLSEFTVL